MIDIDSELKVLAATHAQTVTSGGGAVALSDVDLQGFNAAEILFDIGANGGDTLNGTNYIDVLVEHADDDGTGAAGAYSAVAAADLIGATPASGAIFAVAAAADDEKSYKAGYVGGKRFLQITIRPNGTLTNGNPAAVLVVGAHARNQPTA